MKCVIISGDTNGYNDGCPLIIKQQWKSIKSFPYEARLMPCIRRQQLNKTYPPFVSDMLSLTCCVQPVLVNCSVIEWEKANITTNTPNLIILHLFELCLLEIGSECYYHYKSNPLLQIELNYLLMQISYYQLKII